MLVGISVTANLVSFFRSKGLNAYGKLASSLNAVADEDIDSVTPIIPIVASLLAVNTKSAYLPRGHLTCRNGLCHCNGVRGETIRNPEQIRTPRRSRKTRANGATGTTSACRICDCNVQARMCHYEAVETCETGTRGMDRGHYDTTSTNALTIRTVRYR